MLAIILFWIFLIVWALNGFWSFLPHPIAHLALVLVLVILGLKVFGNPFST